MQIIYSDKHLFHTNRVEPSGSEFVPVSEVPQRATRVLSTLVERKLGRLDHPREFGLDPIHAVHSEAYVKFLEQAWGLWAKTGRSDPALPNFWRRRTSRLVPGTAICSMLDYYSGDPGVCLVKGSWAAILSSANCAATAADDVSSTGGVAFALCRPPGHHAGTDVMRGSCYLNNAAVAARRLHYLGATKVAVIDLDYHHGNGTQEIFYRSGDILTCSIHADPATDYPYYSGYADEGGEGEGEGNNANFVLPRGTPFTEWSEALEASIQRSLKFGAEALVIPLGVDTYKEERNPASYFRLESDDYFRVGCRLAKLNLPTVITMEGGYNLDAIGINVGNFLEGFSAEYRWA